MAHSDENEQIIKKCNETFQQIESKFNRDQELIKTLENDKIIFTRKIEEANTTIEIQAKRIKNSETDNNIDIKKLTAELNREKSSHAKTTKGKVELEK